MLPYLSTRNNWVVVISLLLFTYPLLSQDVIILNSGKIDTVSIVEVYPTEVKYKKLSNIQGPLYVAYKSDIFMIKYANGEKEVIENISEEKKAEPLAQPRTKVFIETDNAQEYEVAEDLTTHINKWNKWNVVNNRNEANAIIQLEITQSVSFMVGYVILKKSNGQEISRSGKFRAYPNAYNGFNGHRAFAIDVLEKYLKHQTLSENNNPTAKDNSVYIESTTNEDYQTELDLAKQIIEWNYWEIASKPNKADFIIKMEIKKSGETLSGFVIIKQISGEELKRSFSYFAMSNEANGYNMYHELAMDLVEEFFKKQLW